MAGEFPEPLEQLAHQLGHLPGIGKRTAERLAFAMLDWDEGELRQLGGDIAELKSRVHPCQTCGNLADADLCWICRNPRRNEEVICVVEQARQIPPFEKCGRFQGRYHVLGGRLAPLDGIDVDDLNLASLYRRIEAGDVEEVILATSPDVEGEATAGYLTAQLRERFELKISRIALGVPPGADLTFADVATMAIALDTRRPVG